jgi:hypothetical protein
VVAAERFTVRDGVRVYDSGVVSITPTFTLNAAGKPVSSQLGLVESTRLGTTTDEWVPAADAVVHIGENAQGRYALPAADAELTGERTVFGTDQPAADYAAQGGLLFGFDTRSDAGQLNGDLTNAVAFSSAYTLESLTGTGWTVSWPDVNWDVDPPVRTITLPHQGPRMSGHAPTTSDIQGTLRADGSIITASIPTVSYPDTEVTAGKSAA